jgi:hypothetical protein
MKVQINMFNPLKGKAMSDFSSSPAQARHHFDGRIQAALTLFLERDCSYFCYRWSNRAKMLRLRRRYLGGDGKHEQMVFEAFAFLISRPVHGKAVRGVYFDDGDQHVARDSEGGDAAEENRKSARASLEIRP